MWVNSEGSGIYSGNLIWEAKDVDRPGSSPGSLWEPARVRRSVPVRRMYARAISAHLVEKFLRTIKLSPCVPPGPCLFFPLSADVGREFALEQFIHFGNKRSTLLTELISQS